MDMVPAITRHARIVFRDHHREQREEFVQETVANCLVAFVRLVELGKQDVAYPAVLAHYAVAQIREGRRVGSSLNIKDVSSQYCQLKKRVSVGRLDHFDKAEGDWKEIVVEDKRSGPAEIAAMRIDFAAWLRTLSRRERWVATTLAIGGTTSATAKKLGVTPSRVSQMRRQLKAAWEVFTGERLPEPSAAVA